MSMQEDADASSLPEGRSDQQNTNEFITLAGLATAAGTSITLGNKAIEWVAPKDSFLVFISDSYPSKDHYVVILEIRNLDLHALYIEKVALEQPLKAKAGEPTSLTQHSLGLGNFDSGPTSLPRRIGPQQSAIVQLWLEHPPQEMTCGEIQMEISRLARSSAETRKTKFLIRGTRGTDTVY
ncbi:MAG TPA: hypothetical protein VI306_09835 [Pyrinomonadaceae bacterium]